jgi:hypothetical protein
METALPASWSSYFFFFFFNFFYWQTQHILQLNNHLMFTSNYVNIKKEDRVPIVYSKPSFRCLWSDKKTNKKNKISIINYSHGSMEREKLK